MTGVTGLRNFLGWALGVALFTEQCCVFSFQRGVGVGNRRSPVCLGMAKAAIYIEVLMREQIHSSIHMTAITCHALAYMHRLS